MPRPIAEITQGVLALPWEEQEELRVKLMVNLHEADQSVDDAWIAEAVRRADEAERTGERGLALEEFLPEMLSRLRR